MQSAEQLRSSGVLVKLSIRKWKGQKYDRNVSAAAADLYGASHDAGRYNKVLVSKDPTSLLKQIERIATEARTYHYDNTLPWIDKESSKDEHGEKKKGKAKKAQGIQMLPCKNLFEYTQKMNDFQARFLAKVAQFIMTWEEIKDEARVRLNGMFRDEDYPDIYELEDRFEFTYDIDPIPSGDHYAIAMTDEFVERVKAETEERAMRGFENAQRENWQRLYDAVEHLVDVCSPVINPRSDAWNYSNTKFQNSLVGNVTKVTEVLTRLNFSDDPDLEKMRRQVEERLCSYDPTDLRADAELKADAGIEAKEIMDQMGAFMGGAQ